MQNSGLYHYANILVSTISSLFLNDKRNADRIFAVTVRLQFSNYETDTEFCRFLHLAVAAPSNYKKVYAALTDRPMGFKDVKWDLVCSHDSAWRDDGIRWALKNAYENTLIKAVAADVTKLKNQREYMDIFRLEIALCEDVFGSATPPNLTLNRDLWG